MRKMIGFVLLWISVGILISFFLPNTFVKVLCILLCVSIGYNLCYC